MAEEKWVTWDGLKYYDSKVKSHIDSKLSDLQSNVPSDQEFNELKERVEDIANEQSQTSAKVDSFQDHIDENEAAIEDLRKFDLKVTSDISALQTHMEYTVKKEDLNSYATEEFVADAIRSAQLSGDIDLSDYYKKGDVDALVVKVQGNIDVTETKINGLSNKINDVSSDVEKNHEIIEQLLVSIENKADEQHQHHLSDIIDYEEPDLTNYATKDDVKDAIDNLLIPDFDNYYTKSEIDKMIPELDNLVTKQELDILTNAVSDVAESLDEKADKTDLKGLASEEFVLKKIAEAELADQDVDLSAYYTKSETEAKIKEAVDAIDVPDVSNLATKEELEAVQNVAGTNSVKLFAIESDLVDLSNELENIPTTYATKEEVAAVEAKVDGIVIPEVPTKVSQLENDVNYLTEHQSLEGYAKLTDIPDVSTFATKTEVANQLDAIKIPTRVSELDNDAKFITEDNLSDYAKRDELFSKDYNDLINTPVIPSIEGLATEQFVKDEIAKIEHPTVDLTGYAKEDWVNEQGFITEVPSEYITESELDAKGYLTEHQDLSEYAKKSDIPESELFVVNFNAPDFEVALEAYNSGKLLLLTNAAPDANGYAVMNYVRDDMITFTKFLTSRSETYGSFNTYYLHSDNTWEVSKEVKLNKVEANVSDAADTELTSIRIGKEVYKIPETDLSEYYTKTEVDTKFENIEHPSLDGYATEQWVTAQGFLKEHQDLSEYAKKSDIPSVEGLASEQFVNDAIANIPAPDLSNYFTKDETTSAISEAIDGIEIPEVDLEPYATKAQVAEQVAVKADNVPFTIDMFVTKPQGSFISGDNLKGLSVTAILTKLLGLQSAPAPDEPDVPDEPTTIVDNIIKNQLGMYQVNEESETIEIPYNYVTYDNTTYDAAPDADYFYQKLDDNGEVIESGYQHVSEENDSMYYVIALPNELKFNENVSVKVWDTTSNTWADALELQMSSDQVLIESAFADAEIPIPVVPEGYTLWIDATLNTCSGEDFRFIIN